MAFVLIFLFVPETKKRTLEELDQVFAVPTSVFINYNTKKALPYWYKRYILRKKDARLEPLYDMDQELDGEETGPAYRSNSRHNGGVETKA